ncbi:MAG: ABC transporter permease, partial [Clostridiaceae bacterium]
MEKQWTTIKARNGWLDINLSELIKYKDLIFLFVKRNFVTMYKQTILGPLWVILNPLITTIMFTVIFGNIAKIPTDGLPQFIFYMAGTTAWGYFANCLNATSNTFVTNAAIFGKVYFPRLTVPVSVVITNLIQFGIQFVMFVVFVVYFKFKGFPINPNLWVLYTPVLVLQMALLGLGFGIIVSSLTTRYRDLTILVSFGVQLWMYATPIVYPVSQIPEKWRDIYLLNP